MNAPRPLLLGEKLSNRNRSYDEVRQMPFLAFADEVMIQLLIDHHELLPGQRSAYLRAAP